MIVDQCGQINIKIIDFGMNEFIGADKIPKIKIGNVIITTFKALALLFFTRDFEEMLKRELRRMVFRSYYAYITVRLSTF